MTFYEAATLAKEAGVKEMWLTHYSPSLVHGRKQYMGAVREVFSKMLNPGKRRKKCYSDLRG